jgi:hypothetical protein
MASGIVCVYMMYEVRIHYIVGQQKLSRVSVRSKIPCFYCEFTMVTPGHTIVSSNSKAFFSCSCSTVCAPLVAPHTSSWHSALPEQLMELSIMTH